MTSQAVYCLSLQIKAPNEDASKGGEKVVMTKNETNTIDFSRNSQQQQQIKTDTIQQSIQIQQPQQSQQQPQQPSNIILVRGSRAENGQIILQNSHDLFSLLSEDDKPVLLQHPRIKAKSPVESGTILFQPASIKNATLDGGTILLQSANVGIKKNTVNNDGSITLQQRINKNGTTDGTFLLQTLKRLDKSQSILVIRNTSNASAASIAATVTSSSLVTTQPKLQLSNATKTSEDSGDNKIDISPPKPINVPLGCDGEPIKLPDNLESLPRADHFPTQRHRWNTNEEIAAILISFDKHSEWQSKEVKTRPKSGSMLLYSRKKVRYRRDGYCWKKRKDGKTTREDHMKLKVQGTECIYGCYVHSAILPTFHRRCYWLLQNPDIVLVHYLNVPYPDDNKMAVIAPSLALWGDKKEWTKEELMSQLKPMFFSEDEPDATNDIEISTAETVEAIVSQLMEKQRLARQAALVKQLECGCPDSTCADGKSCSHPMRRISNAKNSNDSLKRSDNTNQVSSTTPNVLVGSRLYPRWTDRRNNRDQLYDAKTQKPIDSLHFQVIPTTSQQQTINLSNQQNSIRQNLSTDNSINSNSNNSNNSTNSNNNSLNSLNVNTQIGVSETAHNNHLNSTSNRQSDSQQIIVSSNHHHNNSNNNNNVSNGNSNQTASAVNLINNGNSSNTTNNDNDVNISSHSDRHISHILTNHQLHQLHQSNDNLVNQRSLNNNICNNNNNSNNNNNDNNRITVNNVATTSSIVTSAPPLLLSLSQIQGTNGSLLILNGQQQSFVCQTQQQQQQQQQHQHHEMKIEKDCQIKVEPSRMMNRTTTPNSQKMDPNKILKQEAMDTLQQNETSNNNFFSHSMTSPAKDVVLKSVNNDTNNNKDFSDQYPFFNATLDLSQEDIQRTLSANMPLGANATDDHMHSAMHSMDFIENCGPNGPDDDVFVNLDAFDMLVEFPELELDPNKHSFLHSSENSLRNSHMNFPHDPMHHEIHNITDYSPEWAYPEGGVKVLVTGPWNASSSYTVLFDSLPVPTNLVQTGVLRCYCPAHEVGVATLQVASDGYVISNSVNFEYKSPPKIETKCEGNSSDVMYKFSLLNRLESIDEKLQIKTEPDDMPEDSKLFCQPNFEERLVNFCQNLILKQWRSFTPGTWMPGPNRMTLLHFAAALGYSKLVCTLIKWRSENSSLILESEIDALSRDADGCTPLMLACSKGHVETAIALYKWNHNALNVKNHINQSPIEVAKFNGYEKVVRELERLETERISLKQPNSNNIMLSNNFYNLNSSASSSLSSSYQSVHCSNEDSNLKSNDLNSKKKDTSDIDNNENSSSPSAFNDPNHRSHDGVFLRPGAVSSSPPAVRFSKRPSIDSGINVDIRPSLRAGKGLKEQKNRIDRSMSLPTTNSPNSAYGADNGDSFSLSIDRGNDSPSSSNNCSTLNSNISLLSPLRKMDFALCEVSRPCNSPINEQHGSSDDDDDDELSLKAENIDLKQVGGVVGESDAKVLTLAEQIIAAMPDRIKNESDEIMSLGSPLPESITGDTSGMGILSDTFMEPLLDSLPSSHFDQEFNFEFSDHNYRYHDVGTPCSSLSPASSGPLQSPASYSIPQDPPNGSPSPPPTTKDFTEFLQASNSTPHPFEADFSNLTLTDREQRELYEAAKCIQKAYRSYKGRKKLEEQDKERSAAVLIQNYYRRYKQYAYYRQMTRAALVIQNGYRSYCENKRFKKSQCNQNNMITSDQDSSMSCMKYYRNYNQAQHQTNTNLANQNMSSKEPSLSGPLKRTYSQRTQNQAARKIQQFMRQSKNKLQKERAEKEKLVHLHREYLQNLQCHGHRDLTYIKDQK